MAPVAPETVPGWLAACGSLSGAEILTLTEQLCQPLTYGRAALLLASARRLAGTPARLHLFPVQAYPHPERLADCQVIRLPYAQEWLTAAECDDLLAFLKASLTQITEIVRRDAKRLAAALKPSVTPRLMDRRFGDWRVLADEYEHENWLDENDTDGWIRSLMLFWCAGRDSARSCSPWSMNAGGNRSRRRYHRYAAFPGDPARRWLDRRVLRDVVSEARATPAGVNDDGGGRKIPSPAGAG
jgi:hypothetical protein